MSSDPRFPKSVIAIAALYFAIHLLYLAPSLEDIDSTNFALGLSRFDVANHQPHPPGSPVYIALGRAALAVLRVAGPSLEYVHRQALALAIWSALGGAVALIAAFSIFSFLERLSWGQTPDPTLDRVRDPTQDPTPGRAVWATALLGAAPLYWLAGSRPMSDMPGLAVALVSQALLLKGFTGKRALVIGAALAGIAAGIRVQTACLTVPLLLLAMFRQRREGILWIASRPIAALAIGGLIWAIPLVAFSGGVDAYLAALGSQAGEDLAWTGMLWTTPTPRRLVFALWETFVLPWDSIPLGVTVGALALLGVLLALVRQRPAMLLAVLAFGPYAAFHLLFQETVHVRYAMPTLPMMAWFVVCAASATRSLAPAVTALVLAAALWFAVPVGRAYGREVHPAFRAIAAMSDAHRSSGPARVFAHFSLLRPLAASQPEALASVEARRTLEWLGPVQHWRSGRREQVWFLADPKRTDLALFDPQSRRDVTRYRWRVAEHPVLSGTRPLAADWYRIDAPGWFLGEGWSLTPETGGITQSTGTGLDKRPIDGYVRRRSGPMHLVIGGRHFSAAGDPPVVLTLSIDGTPIETWKVDPGPGGVSFLRFVDLPQGFPQGSQEYATLTIAARAEPASRPTPQIAIRQFDIQSSGTLVYGFGEGWHEAEYDNATGVSWRWTSARSILRVSPPQAVVIRLRGESPLKYFNEVPTVRIRAGGRTVGELRPEDDFEWVVNVPTDIVQAGDGAIGIETDRIYLPGQVEGTSDSRQLGLRMFEIDVNPVTP